jgi:hypothetical protein
LGLSLDDLTELVELWDGDRCAPVQSRMAELVADKLAHTHESIAELSNFAAQLRVMSERLEAEPAAGACSDECACVDDSAFTQTISVSLDARPRGSAAIACTLDASQVVGRVQQWRDLIERATHQAHIANGIRLSFPAEPALVGEIASLAVHEQACCAFYTFALTIVDGRAHLDVTAPADAAELVDDLFGAFA